MREDWIEIELGRVGKVVSGGTPKTSVQEYWADEIAWITPADLSGYGSKYISKGRKSISKLGLEKSSARLMPKNSVLFSSRAPVGYVVIAKNELATNQGFKSLVPYSIVDSEYLYYYLKFAKHIAEKNASGTTFKELSGKAFSNLPFKLAPLPEQRAIVAKIEQLFSELDNGIANLKAAKDKLEIYRQAVLKKAFEGELSNSTESIEVVPFGDEIKIVSGSTPKGINDIESSGRIPFYKVSDMNHEGNEVEMKTSNLFIDEAIVKELKIKLYPKGTVIFPKRGGAILTNKKRILGQESAFDLNLMGVLPSEDYLSKYLYYFFVHQDLGKICDGSAVPQINNKNIAPLDFPKCNIEHQRKIISEIESRLSVCDNILANIEEGLEKSEALRQSILKQAFEGKLLSEEELEACRKEPDWEPAEKLLERIKNEKLAKA